MTVTNITHFQSLSLSIRKHTPTGLSRFAVHRITGEECVRAPAELLSLLVLASPCVGPVTAVHSSRRWRTGCLLARCQLEFFKCWGTFNAVGEFATRRNHRVLSVPWCLSWPQSCVHTKSHRVQHTYRKHWCAFKQRECVRGRFDLPNA